jgi:peptidoglycan/LPS O-acetylase OafA/YrhL
VRIPAYRWLFAPPYLLGSAGHVSVVVFFVLSGYLIGGSVFRAVGGGFWSWRSYLIHRFVRLYLVLIPGLLLCAACDWIGMHATHSPEVYFGASAKTRFLDVAYTFTWPVFLGNMGFLQTIFVPVFGSNGALWSLANEFWYYLLFPLGFFALRGGTAVRRRIAFAALFAAIAWFTRSGILWGFPIWLAGALLALLPPPRAGGTFRGVASVLFGVVLFVFAKGTFLPGVAHDYVFGAITFCYIWVLLSARKASGNSKYVRWTRRAAGFSFSLYVVHMPVLLLISVCLAGGRLWTPTNWGTDAIALVVLGFLVVFAYGFGWLTEFRTDKVRRWVEQRLKRPAAGHPAT